MAKAKQPAKTAFIAAPVFADAAYVLHYIPEGQWEKATAFFGETLGLHAKMQVAGHWVEYFVGGVMLALHPDKNPTPRDTGFYFKTQDCDSVAGVLKQRGVRGVTEPRKVGEGVRVFQFEDPFGNKFGVTGK